MSGAGLLLVATLAVPVGMLFACLSRRVREAMSTFLGLAPLPGLAAALLAADGPPLVLDEAGRQFTLALDPPGAILLGVAALLWSIAGIYARTYIGVGPAAGRFSEWWLLTLTGSLGVFIAADLVSFYVTFAVVSLAAWGLVIHEGTPGTLRAGVIYLGLAVLAEISLLMAFVLLATATPGSSLAIRDAMALLPASPWRDATLAFLIVGFGLKVGLVPLHVWLPLAYPAAPIPAAAVISGAISKAGVIGLLRFLPLDAALPDWGAALAAAGACLGLLRRRGRHHAGQSEDRARLFEREPDGFHRHRAGHGAGRGQRRRDHGGGLLRGAPCPRQGRLVPRRGRGAASGARRLWPVLLPAAVLALGFGGLPLTGRLRGEAGGQGPCSARASWACSRRLRARAARSSCCISCTVSDWPSRRTRRPRRRPGSPGPGWRWHSLPSRSPGRFSSLPGSAPSRMRWRPRPLDGALAGAPRRRARRPPAPLGGVGRGGGVLYAAAAGVPHGASGSSAPTPSSGSGRSLASRSWRSRSVLGVALFGQMK